MVHKVFNHFRPTDGLSSAKEDPKCDSMVWRRRSRDSPTTIDCSDVCAVLRDSLATIPTIPWGRLLPRGCMWRALMNSWYRKRRAIDPTRLGATSALRTSNNKMSAILFRQRQFGCLPQLLLPQLHAAHLAFSTIQQDLVKLTYTLKTYLSIWNFNVTDFTHQLRVYSVALEIPETCLYSEVLRIYMCISLCIHGHILAKTVYMCQTICSGSKVFPCVSTRITWCWHWMTTHWLNTDHFSLRLLVATAV